MNKQSFQYSLLRYRHSYLLNEEVNVGILFYFPVEKRVEFLHPNHLQRLSGLYPDISFYILRNYFKAFKRQTNKLNKALLHESGLFATAELNQLIREYYLVEDSTALIFTEARKGLYEDADQIIAFYYRQYLSVYEPKKAREHKDEQYILNEVDNKIHEKHLEYNSALKRDIEIETPYLSEHFNYGWENGTINLITPVGFDLLLKDSITNKACQWRGKLEALLEPAKKHHYRYDLIVSRPESHSLLKTYDDALKLLNDNKAPKRIIEVDEVDSYVEEIARNTGSGNRRE